MLRFSTLLCLIGLVFISAVSAREMLEPEDAAIFSRMFQGRVILDGDLPWRPEFTFPGFDPNNVDEVDRAFFIRFRELALAFYHLRTEDPDAARRYAEGSARLVAQLGLRPSEYEVRKGAYEVFLDLGLLHDAVARAAADGSVRVAVPEHYLTKKFLEEVETNARDTPGVFASVTIPPLDHECARIFWFCPSRQLVTFFDFGIPELKSCLQAHRRLMASDEQYARLVDRVMEPIQQDAAVVDVADTAELALFINRLYRTLDEAGISQRIQMASARRSATARGVTASSP